MILYHLILALLWMLYCFLHSLLASLGFKKMVQRVSGKGYQYYRLYYTLFAFLSLAALIYFGVSIPTIQIFRPPVFILAIGYLFTIAGLGLMMICIKKYFIGLSGLLSLVKERRSQTLIITGVHQYVRHPLYLGTFAFIWGLFLVLPYLSFGISNLIITVYTLIGIRLEESKLITEFGESYRLYKEKVPKLIPFTKAKLHF
jgi:protein-S-isoprenylcysteine O-methyltransferase Ste14